MSVFIAKLKSNKRTIGYLTKEKNEQKVLVETLG